MANDFNVWIVVFCFELTDIHSVFPCNGCDIPCYFRIAPKHNKPSERSTAAIQLSDWKYQVTWWTEQNIEEYYYNTWGWFEVNIFFFCTCRLGWIWIDITVDMCFIRLIKVKVQCFLLTPPFLLRFNRLKNVSKASNKLFLNLQTNNPATSFLGPFRIFSSKKLLEII